MEFPDRTMNTLLKDIVLKGVVVSFTHQSPTKNKKAAIQKMLEAGEFMAKHGESMDQDSFDRLGTLSMKLVKEQRDVCTGWRNLFAHPIDTYTSARDLKHEADSLLSEAQSASFQSRVNTVGEVRQQRADQKAAQQAHLASSLQAPQDAGFVPAHPVNVTAPATLFPSALPHTGLDAASRDGRAYVRLGELEMMIPLDSRTRIGFDGEVLTTRFRMGPIKPVETAPDDQQVRAVKRTASVFTATGTARIIPQSDAGSSGDPSESHEDDTSTTCKFEWVEGPIITALTELEDGDSDTMDSVSDSDLSSD